MTVVECFLQWPLDLSFKLIKISLNMLDQFTYFLLAFLLAGIKPKYGANVVKIKTPNKKCCFPRKCNSNPIFDSVRRRWWFEFGELKLIWRQIDVWWLASSSFQAKWSSIASGTFWYSMTMAFTWSNRWTASCT